jgi:hypothetical protein
MRHVIMLCTAAVLLGAAAVPASAQRAEDRLAVIQAHVDAGKYSDAAAAAQTFLGAVRDDNARTAAMRLLASALRKQGDWQAAAKAYAELRDRFDKGSDDYVRSDATVEVLRASPKGVYLAAAGNPSAAEVASMPTLADDGVLKDALAAVGRARADKLRARLAVVKKSNSAPEIVAILAEVVEGYAQVRFLDPAFPSDAERQAAETVGEALARLQREGATNLREKILEFEQFATARHTLDTVHRKTVAEYEQVCLKMIEAEESFQTTLDKIARQGWAEGIHLRNESVRRATEYRQLSRQCRRLQVIASRGRDGRRR